MKRCALIILLLLNLSSAFGQDETPLNVYYGPIPEGERTFFVASDGDNSQSGTEEEPWATLDYAVSQVQRGDVIVMRGGVYHHSETVRIQTPSGFTDELIVVTAYPGEVPILDFSSQPKERNYHGVRLNANWWHVIGLTIRNASHNGIRMDGSYNILEQVTAYGNHDTGIHMAGGASNNVIRNCDSFHNFNYDPARTPRVGNNADGFSAKFSIGPGNKYDGCRAWENSDDGFDFWEAENTIVVERSWSFGNGDASVFDDPANFEGNGNGFKLGGNFVVADHVVTRSMAFDNFGASGNAKGFDYNNNSGAMTLTHNTAYNNGRNYFFPLDPPDDGQSVFLNNLSAPSSLQATTPPGAVAVANSWQFETEITDQTFVDVDTDLAKNPREPDGSLPDVDLLKPVAGSLPVDGGVILTEPFYGSAPDMGAYEHQIGEAIEPGVSRGSGSTVTNLKVYDPEHAEHWAIKNEIGIGTEPFSDGNATIISLPEDVFIQEWIQTSAESRTKHYLFPAAEFTLAEPGDVIIAHSDDVSPKPEWLSDYDVTAKKLTLSEAVGAERHMTLYRRAVEAGEVVRLGRNSTDGTADAPMYIAAVGSMVTVSAEDGYQSTVKSELHEIYPNPVRAAATIAFSLANGTDISVKIYDVRGRELARLAEGYHRAGSHTVSWNTQSASSGVYYCRLVGDGISEVKKVVLIR